MTELSEPGTPQTAYSVLAILYGPLLPPHPGKGDGQTSPHNSKGSKDIGSPPLNCPGLHSKLSIPEGLYHIRGDPSPGLRVGLPGQGNAVLGDLSDHWLRGRPQRGTRFHRGVWQFSPVSCSEKIISK